MAQKIQFRGRVGLDVESLGPTQVLAFVLAAGTGIAYLVLSVIEGSVPFVLAGLAFVLWSTLVLVTQGVYRHVLYVVGMVLALSQITAFFVLTQPGASATENLLQLFDSFRRL